MRDSGIDAHILQFWPLQQGSPADNHKSCNLYKEMRKVDTLHSPRGKDKTGPTALLVCVSTQFSRSVMSDSLQPHGLQHSRLPCPPPTPRAYSNSCPSSQWCHPTISSSVIPFSSHLQSFPASGSFPMSQFLTLGGQSIWVSASASVLPMNIQDWFPLGLTGLISLRTLKFSEVQAVQKSK